MGRFIMSPDVKPIDDSLREAVMDGNRSQVELIIKNYQGDVNAQDANGTTPALLAAKRNDLPMLKLLVENGADVRTGDQLDQTPMLWALHNKNDEMIEFIEMLGDNPGIRP